MLESHVAVFNTTLFSILPPKIYNYAEQLGITHILTSN